MNFYPLCIFIGRYLMSLWARDKLAIRFNKWSCNPNAYYPITIMGTCLCQALHMNKWSNNWTYSVYISKLVFSIHYVLTRLTWELYRGVQPTVFSNPVIGDNFQSVSWTCTQDLISSLWQMWLKFQTVIWSKSK